MSLSNLSAYQAKQSGNKTLQDISNLREEPLQFPALEERWSDSWSYCWCSTLQNQVWARPHSIWRSLRSASQPCHCQENIIQPISFQSKDLQNSPRLTPQTPKNCYAQYFFKVASFSNHWIALKHDQVPTICNSLGSVLHSNRFSRIIRLQAVVSSTLLPLLLPTRKVVRFLVNNSLIIIV